MSSTKQELTVALISLVICFSWAIFALQYSTHYGVGLFPDSIVYLDAAQSLSEGRGFVIDKGAGSYLLLTHYPPLYPGLLAGVRAKLPGALESVLALNVILLALHGMVVGVFTYSVTNARALSVLSSFFFAIALDSTYIYSWVLSETLFNFLVTLGLFLLYLGRRPGKPVRLMLAALCIGLAGLSRYAALPVIATSFLYLLVVPRKDQKAKRITRASATALGSALPLILLLAYNSIFAGNPTNRELSFHIVGLDSISGGVDILVRWVTLPVVILCVLWLSTLYMRDSSKVFEKRNHNECLTLSIIFFMSYIAFIVLAISFIDLNTPLDVRILSPLYALFVVSFFALIHELFARLTLSRPALAIMAAAAMALTIFQVIPTISFLERAHERGLGFRSPKLAHSKTLSAVNVLPEGVAAYSNYPELIRAITGRLAYLIPAYRKANDGQFDERYFRSMAVMDERLRAEQAVIVWFKAIKDRWYIPAEKDLIGMLGLLPIREFADGTIYKKARLSDD